MELIKKAEKEGGLQLGRRHSYDVNKERHDYLIENRHLFDPLPDLIPAELAEEVWPELEALRSPRTNANTRAQIYKVIEFLLTPGNFRISTRSMCESLGFSYGNWVGRTQVHPSIWQLINKVVGPILVLRSQARVLGAMEDAAIHGDHRDRRLFFEIDGTLKRGGGAGGGNQLVQVNLINDNIDRPSAEVIAISENSGSEKERDEDQ